MEYPTLARRAVARKLELEMMAEELRLLYVAMTRAKEKLILSVALTGGARDLEKLAPDAACPVEPQVMAGCQSVGQWVLLPALARPDGEVLRRAAGVQVPVPAADFGPAWDIRFVDGAEFQAEPEESAISPSGPPDGEMISAGAGEETAALAARLAWHYPHGAEVELPSKLTATQLKGRALDEEVAEAAGRPPRPIRLGRPRFAAEEFGLTPAQKGTALHLVMQYIDFERTERVEQVRAEIARLVERAFLTPQQGEAVDPAKIAAFFASPLGRELMASTSLRREFKFSILVPAADYYPQAGAEDIHIPPEFVDNQALDPRLLVRLQQLHRAVEGGEHAPPVDVAAQEHRGVGPSGHAHVHNVVLPQVDLRRAARPLDDDDVVLRRQGLVGRHHLGDEALAVAEVLSRRHGAPGHAVDDHLRAHMAGGLEQDGVHPHVGGHPRRLGLHHLSPAHLEAVGGDGGVEGHVLGFEGGHLIAVLLKYPAESGHQEAFARVGHGSLYHDYFCHCCFSCFHFHCLTFRQFCLHHQSDVSPLIC